MSVAELIYDWNNVEPRLQKPDRHIGFDDETLRDGLQSPSVCEPSVEKKIELLHLMDALGIDTADIGLPGAGGTHAAGVEMMAREIAEKKLKIRPNCGARAVCVCDTVGHATPDGAREVVKFVRGIIDQQGEKIRLDWHGHQDRGLGVINSIAAIEGGADQVHGSALGMGERVGNTPMDQLLVNLKLMGWIENDLMR